MKFCAKCGNGNDDDSKFCRKCGNPLGSHAGGDTVIAQPPPAPAPVSRPTATPLPEVKAQGGSTTELPPNIAHFLCYVAGWVTGVVFLIIEKKDRATRFHAWQSIVALGGITLISILMYTLFSLIAALRLFGIGWILGYVINALLIGVYLIGLVLWIVLMVKAFQGYDYQLPGAGPIAYNLAYKDQPAESRPRPQQPAPAATKIDLPPLAAQKGADKAPVTKFCIACGESLPQKAVYCSRCGEKQP
jgi:uncharacterized membrane protein/ribosomal protein L40E